MTSYTWTFPALDVKLQDGDFENVVKAVHWRCAATDGSHSADAYGSVALPPPGQPFTDYEALTPEIVRGWTITAMGEEAVAAMQSALASQIAEKAAPVISVLPPPWAGVN